MEDVDRLVCDFEYWRVYLHPNQCYLGRSVIVLKRADVTDLLEITPQEREELFNIAKALKNSISKLFQPDLFNYASLGNVDPLLHMHLIPRYKENRVVISTTFIDHNWGRNYSPYDKSFSISNEVFDYILQTIKSLMMKNAFASNSIETKYRVAIRRSDKLRSYKIDALTQLLEKRESYIHFIEFLVTSSVAIGGALAALLDYRKVFLPLFVLGELFILVSVTLGVLLRNKILNKDINGLEDDISQSTDLLGKHDREFVKMSQDFQANKNPNLDETDDFKNAKDAIEIFMTRKKTEKMHFVTTTHISWLLVSGLIAIFFSFILGTFVNSGLGQQSSLILSGSSTASLNVYGK